MPEHGRAYFVVKRASESPQVSHLVVAFLTSYDDAVLESQQRNERAGYDVADGPFYPTVLGVSG